jgi:hypothetical protein
MDRNLSADENHFEGRPSGKQGGIQREVERNARNDHTHAPSDETAARVFDTIDFTRALNVYNNSFRGASALALVKGFQSIGAGSGDIVIFSELMDSSSLFLTANADTVYYVGWIDLSKGPVVIEQPSDGLGTVNDMWFQWVIDMGKPGPDRGLGGRYLLVGPGYDGPLPEGGHFIAH